MFKHRPLLMAFLGIIALVAATLAPAASARFADIAPAQSEDSSTFRVRIENISGNSALPGPISPGVWAVHDPNIAPFFTTGEVDRGLGLAAIAEDGNAGPLGAVIADQPGVRSGGLFNTPVGAESPGAALPGNAYEFSIEAEPGDYLNFATMLVQTNDIFAAPFPRGIRLFDDQGRPLPARALDVTAEVPFWDVGSEQNEAPGMGPNQAPRQSGPDVGPAESGVSAFNNTTRGLPLPAGIVALDLVESSGTYTMTIENISGTRAITTPIAPVFYATHDRSWTFFETGQAASAGLELLAEDGPPSDLVSEHNGAGGTGMVGASGSGPAFPGDSYQFSVTPTAEYPYLSIASMLVESNDAFLAFEPRGIALLNALGNPRPVEAILADMQRELVIWDAGTEKNQVPGAGNFQPLRTAPSIDVGDDENGTVQRYADQTNDLARPGNGGVATLKIEYVAASNPPQFNVELLNTSRNTAYSEAGLTPVAYALHNDQISFFEIGEPASEGIERLAEDGNVEPLLNALQGSSDVATAGAQAIPSGGSQPGPIFFTQSYSFTVTVNDPEFRYLSLASMLIPSNDTFVAPFPRGIPLTDAEGNPLSQAQLDQEIAEQFIAWDAGTERNQAGAAGPDQAPQQAGPDTGAGEGPGTVLLFAETTSDPVWDLPPVADVIEVTITPEIELDGPGAVFTASNDPNGNEVIMYNRGPDGRLTYFDRFATGGNGIGAGLAAPADPLGSQDSLLVYSDYLFVVNAGSNSISSFRISRQGLSLLGTADSQGANPVSLSVYDDLLYVLNTGDQGNIAGFRIGSNGTLSPLEDAVRGLNTGNSNPPNSLAAPSEIGFSPDGQFLVVTEKASDEINVFLIDADGRPASNPTITQSVGGLPFSFTFTAEGILLVTEVIGAGAAPPNNGALSSYRINSDGSLTVISSSVGNNQTATCWIVYSAPFAYVSNTATNNISSYEVAADGSLTLLEEVAFPSPNGAAPTDMALIGDFIYVLNANLGTVTSYEIDRTDGSVQSLSNAVNTLSAFPGNQGAAAYDFNDPVGIVYLPLIVRP